jgi:hypothetical protein
MIVFTEACHTYPPSDVSSHNFVYSLFKIIFNIIIPKPISSFDVYQVRYFMYYSYPHSYYI